MASFLSILFLMLLLFPISVLAQTYRNITRGSYLSTDDNNPFCVSPSGDFAFGFRQVEEADTFLLAIWFEKVPEKTIVWTLNRNRPMPKGSKVQLTRDGKFVLYDPQGKELWSAETGDDRVVENAAMLDTGNFVLRSNGSITWRSFDHPTDTILPTQTLNLGMSLMSRVREKDSVGRFELRLQADGNLVLWSKAMSTGVDYVPYWETETDGNGNGNGSRLVFNQSGRIYLELANRTFYNLSSVLQVSTEDFYHRATLDFDGVFRHYTHPKAVPSNGRWPQSWTVERYLPQDLCMTLSGDNGSGACGYNSYCKMGDDQRPACQCPDGYTYMDPKDTFKGCKQNFSAQSCEINGSKEGEFEIIDMLNTDWPRNNYEWFIYVDEDWCRKSCLEDCLCAVAVIRDGNCWKKRFPLGYGRMNPSVGGKAFIKVGKSPLQPYLPAAPPRKKKDKEALIMPGSIMLGGSLFLNLLFLGIYLVGFHPKHKKLQQDKQGSITNHMNLCCFTYRELKEATNGFAEELGRGAFATVYKGVLASDSGTIIAVKMLNKLVEDGEKGFKNEVNAIGRTNHKNLVQLLGFCDQGPSRLLVYEFMSNGSLADYLFGSSRPPWYQRIQIIFGVARGLAYLHEECSTRIIHCDMKPQNILLDDSFVARISDFGLAKLLKTDQTRTRTDIRGTKGYVAPEWFKNMAITAKVDVYSFGIILLEIISCRKNVESNMVDEEKAILSEWAYDCYQEGKLHLLVGENQEEMNDIKRLDRFVKVAIWCIQENPSLRPTTKKVTEMLEGAVEVSMPPDPLSFINSLD